ncbi:MAG: hypothetical protein NTX66_02895 [Candidatus Falkowbacteria bacterium]|nr:hypothetical protein [Candidatus Falkowbacteria bacterium]
MITTTIFMVVVTNCAKAQDGLNDSLNVENLTELWVQTPNLPNNLDNKQQIIYFENKETGGRIYNFRYGNFPKPGEIITDNDFRIEMSKIQWPRIMEYQSESMKMVVNLTELEAPTKLSHQCYDLPKIIKGRVVVRAVDPGYNCFFIVVSPKGDWYVTRTTGEERWLKTHK